MRHPPIRHPQHWNILNELGHQVSDRRKARGWSVRTLAVEAGVSWWAVSDVERGRGTSLATLARLAEALEVELFIDLESRP